MVQNKIGFASRKCYGIEPDYYTKIFNGWTAVYLIGDAEYHISLFPDFYNQGVVREIEVLKQTKTCRVPVRQYLKSIKSAVEVIRGIKDKEMAQNA